MLVDIKHRFTNKVLCSFDAIDIKNCLQQAVKDGANLRYANLRGANLYGANLYGANLSGADLCDANLSGANLRGADLSGANLYGANLYGANLRGANLCDANLCDANLSGADLSGADLCDANLSGANLRGANLYGANLCDEKIAIAPILISGLTWQICISESYLEIGCERHLHTEWSKFSDEEIAKMESRAREFWKQNKSWLLSACKAHRKESLAYRKANTDRIAIADVELAQTHADKGVNSLWGFS